MSAQRIETSALLVLPLLALTALLIGAGTAASVPGTRTYFIAADEVVWDYAPSGRDEISGQAFDAAQRLVVDNGPHHIGKVAMKAQFREYTDSTFSTLKPRPPAWQHLGLLGPLLRAEVGDTIRVVFRNNTRFPASLHPHGVSYEKSSEGAPYVDSTSDQDKADDGVPTGGTHVYVWPVPARAGPASGDHSSVLWMYHSHVREEQDVNAGLIGPMIVSARGSTKPDGSPKDVDREFVVAFLEQDENASSYFPENAHRYMGDPDGVQLDTVFGIRQVRGTDGQNEFRESLNGFLYGALPMLTMPKGERVRWYLMGTTNFEVHAPHWHGNTVEIQHMRTDVASLNTMGMVVADMVPDNPGIWLFHCHVANHLRMGMQGRYRVLDR
jgi:hephaestin